MFSFISVLVLFVCNHFKVKRKSLYTDKDRNNLWYCRSPPVDKWFHLAVAWDQTVNEAYILLNVSKIGVEPQTAGTHLRNNSHSSYDIGLKRDGPTYMRGYIRDLMIIGRAVTVEEIANITGNSLQVIHPLVATFTRDPSQREVTEISRSGASKNAAIYCFS